MDDHAIEYGSYEGITPEGHYGAGAAVIWDSGEYDLVQGDIRSGRIEFVLHGRKLKGGFVLYRMAGKLKEWLLMNKNDTCADVTFSTKTRLTPGLLKKLAEKVPR